MSVVKLFNKLNKLILCVCVCGGGSSLTQGSLALQSIVMEMKRIRLSQSGIYNIHVKFMFYIHINIDVRCELPFQNNNNFYSISHSYKNCFYFWLIV